MKVSSALNYIVDHDLKWTFLEDREFQDFWPSILCYLYLCWASELHERHIVRVLVLLQEVLPVEALVAVGAPVHVLPSVLQHVC